MSIIKKHIVAFIIIGIMFVFPLIALAQNIYADVLQSELKQNSEAYGRYVEIIEGIKLRRDSQVMQIQNDAALEIEQVMKELDSLQKRNESIRSAFCSDGIEEYCPSDAVVNKAPTRGFFAPDWFDTSMIKKTSVRASITLTGYTPECHETDGGIKGKDGLCYWEGKVTGDPCKGSAGYDQCHFLAVEGVRTMALSYDLASRNWDSPFKYGDWVLLESETDGCNGVAVVVDSMNTRFTDMGHYGDLFYLPGEKRHGRCNDVSVTKLDSTEFPYIAGL